MFWGEIIKVENPHLEYGIISAGTHVEHGEETYQLKNNIVNNISMNLSIYS